jgi:hypothetical protein
LGIQYRKLQRIYRVSRKQRVIAAGVKALHLTNWVSMSQWVAGRVQGWAAHFVESGKCKTRLQLRDQSWLKQ